MNDLHGCLRCGRAAVPGKAFDFCPECWNDLPRPASIVEGPWCPPLWHEAGPAPVLLGFLLAGMALGWAVEAGLRLLGVDLQRFLLHFGAVAGAVVFARRLRSVVAWFDRAWKRRTAARLGLAHLPPDRCRLVISLSQWECPRPADCGFLGESESALAFLSRDGRLVEIPWRSVRSVTPVGGFGSWWAQLDLDDGTSRWISVREGGEMAWGCDEATSAFGLQVESRLRRPEYVVPRWAREVRNRATVLLGRRVGALPEWSDQLPSIGGCGQGKEPLGPSHEQRGREIVAMALCLLLLERGWTLSADPGRFGRLNLGETEIEPFRLLEMLRDGERTPREWQERWSALQLADVDLGEFAGSDAVTKRLSQA